MRHTDSQPDRRTYRQTVTFVNLGIRSRVTLMRHSVQKALLCLIE